jgi:hypothetical protein
MQLFKALAAFYTALFNDECEHPRVAPPGMTPDGASRPHSSFCPDCGYKIRALWSLCRCRTCGAKRQPKRGMDGRISPLYRYCQHCGQTDFQLIKRERIHVHEMPFALLTKEIDYTEERRPSPKRTAPNPFNLSDRTLDIVEGEVLHRSEQIFSRTQQPESGFFRKG